MFNMNNSADFLTVCHSTMTLTRRAPLRQLYLG